MNRKTFLTFASIIALSIGFIATFLPNFLLVDMKYAVVSETGLVMARTAGVFLMSFGVLNFLVRADVTSPTMVSLLFANALLQLLILPVDPLAYAWGVYGSALSFIPNTVLHVFLLLGFIYFWRDARVSLTTEKATQ